VKELSFMFAIRNPVLALAWGLPAVAVAASVLSLVVALRTPESELPEQYHWEGFQLDRDFSQAARATELNVHATLSGFGASGHCAIALRMSGVAPDSLELLVAHSTQPRLDQRVTLTREASGTRTADSIQRYSGSCQPAPDAHWRLELVDAKGGWAARQAIRGILDGAAIDAVSGKNE
jgi:hypothetical protein